MDSKFEEVFRYSLKAWWSESDEKTSKTLGFIANALMDIAHQKGWQDDVSRIIDDNPPLAEQAQR